MLPMAIYESIVDDNELQNLGISEGKVFELQSVDERPVDSGYFVVINWQESTVYSNNTGINKAPRFMMIWVHTPQDETRDYRLIDRILNRLDDILLPIEHKTGSDGMRVTCITKQGRSGNLIDDGWKTIARNATYGVLYDETTA